MLTIIRTLRPIDAGIIGLTLLTAAIHIALAQPLFILNGIGYLGLLGAVYLPWVPLSRWQPRARVGLLGYAALTMILYFVTHPNGMWMEDGLGILTKMAELILILLIVRSVQNES